MRSRDDAGAATVLVMSLFAVLASMVTVVVAVAALVVARHQVETAADLAALSGARHAAEGEPAACGAARAVVRRHGSRLDECRLVDLDVQVRVSQRAPGRLGALGRLRASARAGAR